MTVGDANLALMKPTDATMPLRHAARRQGALFGARTAQGVQDQWWAARTDGLRGNTERKGARNG